MSSIVKDVKEVLGIDSQGFSFDTDIVMHINTAVSTLRQLGATDHREFIVDSGTLWEDVFKPEMALWLVRSYVYLRCRLLFDPPSNSVVQTASEKQISELDWRIQVLAESESK